MSKWNTNPQYVPLSEINQGKKYNQCDFILAEDINKLFENVKFLKGE